jgi:hypothetical protein
MTTRSCICYLGTEGDRTTSSRSNRDIAATPPFAPSAPWPSSGGVSLCSPSSIVESTRLPSAMSQDLIRCRFIHADRHTQTRRGQLVSTLSKLGIEEDMFCWGRACAKHQAAANPEFEARVSKELIFFLHLH